MADPHANALILKAGASVEAASLVVILLHGRGGSARDILGLASGFNLPDAAYIAPEAAGHTWYPRSFMSPRPANEPYLSSALARVAAIVRSVEASGVERRRIVIGGFSQGACLATEFVARNPARYGALLAFTGGLIGPEGSISSAGYDTETKLAGMPVFLGSGDPDPHVPWSRVEESAAVLRSLGAAVTAQRYPGRPHTITEDEITETRSLLLTVR